MTPAIAARRGLVPRLLPAICLFFFSPLIAEYVLGNIAIDQLGALLLLAPMYGAGALLVREVTRRAGGGWPTMVVLGLVYAVVEEGFVTQTLFNPSYFGLDLLGYTPMPLLGMGAWWTIYVLTLHTVWSTSVAIALAEELFPTQRTTPWLGWFGLTCTAILFVLGATANFYFTYMQEQFVATPLQLLGTLVVVVVLLVFAFTVARRPVPVVAGTAPRPWRAGIAAFLASSLFVGGMYLPFWITVGAWLALFVAAVVVIRRWSGRTGWSATHRVALAGGALLTYVWHAFPQTPIIGSGGTTDLIGNLVFAAASVALLVLGVARSRHG